MKTVEFEGTMDSNGQIAVPPHVARQLPTGDPVHIVVLWEASNGDLEWRNVGRQRCEGAFAPEDSIYEQLIDDASAR